MINIFAHWLLLFTMSVSESCVTLQRFVYPTSRVSVCNKSDPDRKYNSSLENSILSLSTNLHVFILSFLAAEG